ncbi:MAG: D-alanyl-D-alanine carboxypeptidase family protein, partial [Oscillospiraceae bacterium]
MKTGKKALSIIITITMILSITSFYTYASDMKVAVKAKSAVLMDCSTGKVLMSMNENEKLYPASVTKVMSLLLITEALDSGKLNLSDKVRASRDAIAKGGSQIWLKENEEMTVDELLRATAIGSANDACTALGEQIAGSEAGFVALMNERAQELGMKNTYFENCTGLDDNTQQHLTTAYDIALMSRELLSHDIIQKYTTVWMDSLRGGATELVNTNKLVRFYKGTTGLKTGTTSKAGHCLAASAKRGNTHLIAVVLGADSSTDRFEGAKAMLNWGFANYSTLQPKIDPALITKVNVIHGTQKSIMPKIPEATNILVENSKKKNLTQKINLAIDVEAPIEKDQVLGTVEFLIDGEKIAEYSLTADTAVARLSFGD